MTFARNLALICACLLFGSAAPAQPACLQQVELWHQAAQIATLENRADEVQRHYTDIWQCCHKRKPLSPTHWNALLDAGLHLGADALRTGKVDEAQRLMTPLLDNVRGDTALLNYGLLLHNAAVIEQEQNPQAAQQLYLRALRIKEQTLDGEWHTTVAQTLANLGQLCLSLNQLDSAEYYMLRYGGITMRLEGERSYAAAVAYANVGGMYLARDKWKDARQVSKLGLEVLDSYAPVRDTLRLIIRTATNLSRAYAGLKELKQATEIGGTMVADLRKINAPIVHEELWLRITLARVFEERELYKQAQEQYAQAHRIAAVLNELEAHPWLLWNEARMHGLLLDFPAAENALRKAVDSDWLTDDEVEQTYLDMLVQVLLEQDKIRQARKVNRKIKRKNKSKKQ